MAGRGELTSSEVTLGETTFYFKRALPMEAFDIFEELRPALAEMSEAIKAAQDSQAKGMSTESVFLGAAVDGHWTYAIGDCPKSHGQADATCRLPA